MIASKAPVRTTAGVPEHEPEADPKSVGELALRIVRRLSREGGR